jgi:hypothetical protein
MLQVKLFSKNNYTFVDGLDTLENIIRGLNSREHVHENDARKVFSQIQIKFCDDILVLLDQNKS